MTSPLKSTGRLHLVRQVQVQVQVRNKRKGSAFHSEIGGEGSQTAKDEKLSSAIAGQTETHRVGMTPTGTKKLIWKTAKQGNPR